MVVSKGSNKKRVVDERGASRLKQVSLLDVI